MSVYHLTKENFESEILNSEKPVLVDFYAAWCGPCKMLSPVIDELADETDEVKIMKVNVEEEPELAKVFTVMSIPTLALIENGVVTKTSVGVKPKSAIREMLQIG